MSAAASSALMMRCARLELRTREVVTGAVVAMRKKPFRGTETEFQKTISWTVNGSL
jgi:hypothetical protein